MIIDPRSKFDDWAKKQEEQGLGWTGGLPVVPKVLPLKTTYKTVWSSKRVKIGWFWFTVPYCYQVVTGRVPVNSNSSVWTDPKFHSNDDFTDRYHPGAVWELRSRPIANGAGQQACYDANYRLIKTSPGWGSKDRRSPCASFLGTYNLANIAAHCWEDVDPFNWAFALDGDKHGDNVAIYMLHRPPSI